MPIPTPRNDESKNAFMGRCMGMLKNESKPRDQKIAMCFSQWKDKEKTAEGGKKKKWRKKM